ncbi:Mitochondrial distribution and morphology protein 12, partial [Coemansia spiralis]
MAVRFTYVEHQSWDIAPPTMPLYFNMEVSIRIKDEEAAELRQKLDAYYASLASSLDEFPLDLVYADKVAECRSLLQSLAAGAATEQVYFQQTLVQTLRNTHPADTLVVVVVYEALQGKVVEWNLKFSELVRLYIQVDRSGRGGAGGPTRRAGDAARLTYAPGHELDSLEIIDELHSAASHHYPPADAGAHAATRFEMPRLSPSPSASVADLAELGTRAGDALGERSRLHRRLSMEMMRFECARLGCRTEKQSRAAEHADDSELKPVPKTKGGHGSADSNTHARQQQQEQHLGGAEPPVDVEPPVDAEQRASGRAARLTWHANPSGFSTSRLV